MTNQSVIESNVELDQLKDIENLMPDMDRTIAEKVATFISKSDNQLYIHKNEGYIVIVQMTGEVDATDILSDYLRKRTELNVL